MTDQPPSPPSAGSGSPPEPTISQADNRFPCPACGASMHFDPGKGHLVCGHCGNEAAIEDDAGPGPWGGRATIREQDFQDALKNRMSDVELEVTQIYACKSCGAHVEFDPQIHAASCPFCASPIVGAPGPDRHIRPQGLVPFAIDEKTAHRSMAKWLGRQWFAPTGLAQYARKGRAMDGIYIPYWTFDAQTDSHYTGQRGDYYYVQSRNSKGETQTVRKIRWSPRRGRVARFFDDVLVVGSRTLPQPVLEALTPWDLSRLTPYAPDYLAGMRSETYSIDLDEAFNDARTLMNRVIERDVRFDIGGDRQTIHRIDTDLGNVTFKHVLLPIWVAVYRYRGKVYQVLINGQSGRVQGDRPYSTWKIALAVLLAVIVGIGIAYGVAVIDAAQGSY